MKEGVDQIVKALDYQIWSQTLLQSQMLGTLNMMISSELNSLMSHTFKSLLFYPTISYHLRDGNIELHLLESPRAIKCNTKHSVNNKGTTPRKSKQLRTRGTKTEQWGDGTVHSGVWGTIRRGLYTRKVTSERVQRVFKPSYYWNLSLSDEVLNLTLRNATDHVTPIVALTLQEDQKKAFKKDKGKQPMSSPSPIPSDSWGSSYGIPKKLTMLASSINMMLSSNPTNRIL